MILHACSLCTWKAEAGELSISRFKVKMCARACVPAYVRACVRVPGQVGPQKRYNMKREQLRACRTVSGVLSRLANINPSSPNSQARLTIVFKVHQILIHWPSQGSLGTSWFLAFILLSSHVGSAPSPTQPAQAVPGS